MVKVADSKIEGYLVWFKAENEEEACVRANYVWEAKENIKAYLMDKKITQELELWNEKRVAVKERLEAVNMYINGIMQEAEVSL